ncbi:MAG: hypothetical protein EB084_15415 [Proteobacteria bacterium]|nr:hypothetical protein [Pseudomonadota bacterium]
MNDVHNVVTGYAAKNLGNFLKNDWDAKSGYTNPSTFSKSLTTSEKSYLGSLNGLKPQTTYYVDLSGKSVSTSSFKNTSSTTSSTSQSVSSQTVGNTIIITTTYTTVKTTTNTKYNTTAKQYALMFDITGDSVPDYPEWLAPRLHDGLRALPVNGRIENANQLFGTAGGFIDGFDKLAVVCDKDHNGWVEGTELEGLCIRVDANHDGKSTPDELQPLSQYGVVRIAVAHKNFLGRYVTRDGKDHFMWDWWPAAMEVRKLHADADDN